MYKGKTVGVVVPAYNEAALVGEVVETVPAFVDRVYVVDDRSTDDTWAEIQRAARRVNEAHGRPTDTVGPDERAGDRVVTVRHEENRGRGAATKTGYRRALADGVDVVAVMDGDGQMDPAELDRIVDPVVEGRADYAKGNRLWYRENRTGMSRWRLFGNTLLTFLTKASSGYWKMFDAQNGYTAISREALETIPLDELYDRYGFLNDVLATLNVYDQRVADVPHPAVYGDEQSGIAYSSFVPRLSGLLLSNLLWRLKVKYLVTDFHPLVFLYGLGAVGVGASAFGFAAAVWQVAAPGPALVTGGLALLSGLVGGLLLVLGMIFDMRANADLSVRPSPGARGTGRDPTADPDDAEDGAADRTDEEATDAPRPRTARVAEEYP